MAGQPRATPTALRHITRLICFDQTKAHPRKYRKRSTVLQLPVTLMICWIVRRRRTYVRVSSTTSAFTILSACNLFIFHFLNAQVLEIGRDFELNSWPRRMAHNPYTSVPLHTIYNCLLLCMELPTVPPASAWPQRCRRAKWEGRGVPLSIALIGCHSHTTPHASQWINPVARLRLQNWFFYYFD